MENKLGEYLDIVYTRKRSNVPVAPFWLYWELKDIHPAFCDSQCAGKIHKSNPETESPLADILEVTFNDQYYCAWPVCRDCHWELESMKEKENE